MIIPTSILIFAALFPLSIYSEIRQQQKLKEEYKITEQKPEMLIFIVGLSSLFYSEVFWQYIGMYVLPLFIFCFFCQSIAKRLFSYRYSNEQVSSIATSSLVIPIFIYFIFMHDGALSNEPQVISNNLENTVSNTSFSLFDYWPYGVAAIILLVHYLSTYGKGKKRQEANGLLVLLMLVSYPLLPFFTSQYWLALLIFSISYIFAQFQSANHAGGGAGAISAFIMFYMYASFMSILVYGLLF